MERAHPDCLVNIAFKILKVKKLYQNKGGFRLTRLKLERQSKNSASTIFGQLVVNR